jgi:hypothetical protein
VVVADAEACWAERERQGVRRRRLQQDEGYVLAQGGALGDLYTRTRHRDVAESDAAHEPHRLLRHPARQRKPETRIRQGAGRGSGCVLGRA